MGSLINEIKNLGCKVSDLPHNNTLNNYVDYRSLIVDIIREFLNDEKSGIDVVDLDEYWREVTFTDNNNDIVYGWNSSNWFELIDQDLKGKGDLYEKIDNLLTKFYNEIFKKYI